VASVTVPQVPFRDLRVPACAGFMRGLSSGPDRSPAMIVALPITSRPLSLLCLDARPTCWRPSSTPRSAQIPARLRSVAPLCHVRIVAVKRNGDRWMSSLRRDVPGSDEPGSRVAWRRAPWVGDRSRRRSSRCRGGADDQGPGHHTCARRAPDPSKVSRFLSPPRSRRAFFLDPSTVLRVRGKRWLFPQLATLMLSCPLSFLQSHHHRLLRPEVHASAEPRGPRCYLFASPRFQISHSDSRIRSVKTKIRKVNAKRRYVKRKQLTVNVIHWSARAPTRTLERNVHHPHRSFDATREGPSSGGTSLPPWPPILRRLQSPDCRPVGNAGRRAGGWYL
jgi:hypothetical protein